MEVVDATSKGDIERKDKMACHSKILLKCVCPRAIELARAEQMLCLYLVRVKRALLSSREL